MFKFESAFRRRKFTLLLFLPTVQAFNVFAQSSIDAAVDATDAPKSILHVREKMQVEPGN